MGSLTDQWENFTLEILLRGHPYLANYLAAGSTRMLALFGTIGENQTGGGMGAAVAPNEITGAGYRRQPILGPSTTVTEGFSVDPANPSRFFNSASITFVDMPACTVAGFGIFLAQDSLFGNSPLFYNAFAPIPVAAGAAVVFPAGSIVITLD